MNLERLILPAILLATLAASPAAAAGFTTAEPAPDAQPVPGLLVPQRVYDSAALLRGSAAETEARLDHPEGFKDPRLAMLYSLIVPGLGELWLGRTTRAGMFFAAEAGIWTAYGVFQSQGGHRRELYQEYAAAFAGVPIRGDDDYYRVIGNFVAADGPFSANEQIRREARARFPNDRAAQDRYVEENGYFSDDAWEWDSDEAFDRYKEMRSRSLDSYNNADLTLGLLIANRLLSALDAALLAGKHNRALGDDPGSLSWGFEAGPAGPGAKVALARTF